MIDPPSSVETHEIFRNHYESDSSHWGKNSGGGSDPYHTIEYRGFIDKFNAMNDVKSIVDIGCGDWQFSRFLNLTGIDYLGFDVVASVVARNTELYGSNNVNFAVMPDSFDNLPNADLLIMKDVLQHLPNDTVLDFNKNVFPKYRFCMISNSFKKIDTPVNTDIAIGDFRCLDLTKPPFSFPGSYVLEFSSALWERIRTLLIRNNTIC